MAAPNFAFTIHRVAEMFGEDLDALQEIALEMEPADGLVTVWGDRRSVDYRLHPQRR